MFVKKKIVYCHPLQQVTLKEYSNQQSHGVYFCLYTFTAPTARPLQRTTDDLLAEHRAWLQNYNREVAAITNKPRE